MIQLMPSGNSRAAAIAILVTDATVITRTPIVRRTVAAGDTPAVPRQPVAAAMPLSILGAVAPEAVRAVGRLLPVRLTIGTFAKIRRGIDFASSTGRVDPHCASWIRKLSFATSKKKDVQPC